MLEYYGNGERVRSTKIQKFTEDKQEDKDHKMA